MSASQSLEQEPPTKKRKGEYVLFEMIDDVVNRSTEDIPDAEKARDEVSRYAAESATLEEDPLIWWKRNVKRYPALSCLAQKYLAISATSVPSERAFSCAGNIVNKKQSCLLPDTV